MEEQENMTEVIAEVKNATEDDLREVIEKHFKQMRAQGMKVGAVYLAAAVYGTIQKHLKKASPSLRDYKRMTDDIIKIISVQLGTEQNDSELPENVEEDKS